MVPVILILALVVSAVSIALSPKPEGTAPPLLSLAPGAGVAILAALLLPRFLTPAPEASFTIGIGLGAVAALLSALTASRDPWVAPAGYGVAMATVLQLVPNTSLAATTLGLLIGAGLVAATLVDGAASVSAVACLAVAAANQLGAKTMPDGPLAIAGSAFGAGLLLVGLVTLAVGRGSQTLKAWAPGVAFVLGILVTGALGQLWLKNMDYWLVGSLGALAAWVIAVLEGAAPKTSSLRSLLAGALVLGVATLGFSLGRGFGMALALASIAILGAALRSRLALLAAGPLVSLVLYRLFREMHVDASKALDLGQHFALVGFLAGVLVVLAGDEWLADLAEGKDVLKGVGLAIAALATFGLIPLVGMLLGSRGFIGWIVGLGIGGFFQSLHLGRSSRPIAVAIGVGAGAIYAFPAVLPLLEVARDEKVKALGMTAAGLTFAVLAALALGRSIGRRESVDHA